MKGSFPEEPYLHKKALRPEKCVKFSRNLPNHDTDKKELRFETANNAFSQTIGKRSHHFSITTVSKSEGHRISSSRPTKLIPTHGGKPGKTLGRLSSGESFLHSKFCTLLLRNIDNELRAGVAPPRYYYVIALRRLLC